MKVLITLLLLFSYLEIILGQENLVIDPSFEDFTSCPIGNFTELIYWYSASNGSPDYLNKCSSDPSKPFSVPTHSSHHTMIPRSGSAYVAIITLHKLNHDKAIREYISTKLKKPLVSKKKYFVVFHSSPLYSSRKPSFQCFIDKLGCSFTKDLVYEVTEPLKPMKRYNYVGNEGKLLDQNDIWTKTSGILIGNGEQYMTIGNFFENSETKVSQGCIDYFVIKAFYYLDDIGVYEFDPLPDTILICTGETRRLGAQFLDGTYRWNTGSTDSIITVNESGQYIINIDMDGLILSDTVQVIRSGDIEGMLPVDTSMCEGEKLIINLPISGSYSWSTGEMSNVVELTQFGIYGVSLTNKCGDWYREFEVADARCFCQVHSANIFNPKSTSGNNEMVLAIDCRFDYKLDKLRIFDKWGNVVFETNEHQDNKIKWNGLVSGSLANAGVFTWLLEYNYVKNGKEVNKKETGSITVLY